MSLTDYWQWYDDAWLCWHLQTVAYDYLVFFAVLDELTPWDRAAA